MLGPPLRRHVLSDCPSFAMLAALPESRHSAEVAEGRCSRLSPLLRVVAGILFKEAPHHLLLGYPLVQSV